MNAKELITNLLDCEMREEVFVQTENGLKKIQCVMSVESDTSPRYYIAILTE